MNRIIGAAALVVSVILATSLQAANLYWQGQSSGGGAPGASNIWNLADLNWNPQSDYLGIVQAWVNGETAVFDFTAGTIDLGADNIAFGGLDFLSTGYVISNVGAGTFTANSGAAIFVDAGVTATIARPILGAAGITKTGNGILILSGLSTYSGATTINGGTLRSGAAGAVLPTGTTVSLGASGTWDLNNNAATVAAITGSGNITLGNATLTVTNDGVSFGGSITGSGGLTKTGAGTMMLTASSGYTGVTTIGGTGALTLSGGGALTATSRVAIGAGTTFTIDNTAVDNDNRVGDSTIIDFTGGGTFNFIGNAAGTDEAVGELRPSGTLALSTINTSGTGSLTFSSVGTRGAGSLLNFNIGAGTTVHVTGMTSGIIGPWARIGDEWAGFHGTNTVVAFNNYTALGGTVDPATLLGATLYEATGNVTLSGTGEGLVHALKLNPAASATFAQGSHDFRLNSGGLLKTGANNVVFTSTGGRFRVTGSELIAHIADGTVTIDSELNFTGTGARITMTGGGTLRLLGTNNIGSTGSTQRIGGGVLELGGPSNVTFTAAVLGPGQLIKSGSGTLTFTNDGNSFNNLQVRGGVVVATGGGSAATIGTGNSRIGAGSTLTIDGGGEVHLGRDGTNTLTYERNVNFGTGGGLLNFTNRNAPGNGFSVVTNADTATPGVVRYATRATTTDWSLSQSARINQVSGSGALVVEMVNGAIVSFYSNDSWSAPVTLRGHTLADFDISSTASQKTGRFFVGDSTVRTLNAIGGLTLENALQITIASNTHTINGNITLAPGAQVATQGRGTGTSGTFHTLFYGTTVGGTTITISDGARLNIDARIREDQRNAGGVTLRAHTAIQPGGTLAFQQSQFRTDGDASNFGTGFHTVLGNIIGTGTTASDARLVVNLGLKTANAGNDGGVNWAASTGNLVVNGSGLGGLRLEGTAARLSQMLHTVRSGPGTTILATVGGSGGYLTLAPGDATLTLNFVPTWPGTNVGLRVVDSYQPSGAGTGIDVSLANYASWSRNVFVDADAELAVGSGGINFGALLAGYGRVSGGPVTIGGVVSPGASIGTLTLGDNALFNDGSSFQVHVGAGGLSDLLAIEGDLTIGSGVGINVLNPLDADGSSYVIASFTGSLTGGFDVGASTLPAGYFITYSANEVILQVPEPGSLTLAAVAVAMMAGALYWRRRRQG